MTSKRKHKLVTELKGNSNKQMNEIKNTIQEMKGNQ
jgi:hypothetical protein